MFCKQEPDVVSEVFFPAGGLCNCAGSRSGRTCAGHLWCMGSAVPQPIRRQRTHPHRMCCGELPAHPDLLVALYEPEFNDEPLGGCV